MHACIAALSQTVPAVAIAYSRKFLGVMETIGVEDIVVDPQCMTADEDFCMPSPGFISTKTNFVSG